MSSCVSTECVDVGGTIISSAILLAIVKSYGGTAEEADAVLVRLRDGQVEYPRLPSETEELILAQLADVRKAVL